MSKIPFDVKEREVVKEIFMGAPGMPGFPIFNSPITIKENYKRFIAGNPLWMPTDRELQKFNPVIIPDNVARAFVIENQKITPEQFGGPDMFGIQWEYVPTVSGSMVRPGRPALEDANDWEKVIKMPDVDSYEWEACFERNKDILVDNVRPVQTTIFTGFFERLVSFMDMENALVAMIDEEQVDAVKALFDRLADIYEKIIDNMVTKMGIDAVWIHDDWGSQRAPLFSREVTSEVIVPALRKLVDACHKRGLIFEFHSCGKIETLVPCMIEAGVDMWAGQPMNDYAAMYRDYSEDIKLGVEFDGIPVEGTDQELRDFAAKAIEQYPKNVFLSKAFALPKEAYLAFYEESRKAYQ